MKHQDLSVLKIMKTHILSAAFIVGVVLGHSSAAIAADDAMSAAPPALPVSVERIAPMKTQIWNDFSARLVATEYAQIKPQVSGRITAIQFQDGQNVQEGAVLFEIDPRPYQAALNQAKAELSSAQTQADLAQKELKRAKGLVKTNAIAARVLDERQSTADFTKAAVERAQALVEQAEINVDYAYIKAPFSGRIGRAEIKAGNVVEATINAPVLTSLVATDKIYADFEVDESTYLDVLKAARISGGGQMIVPVKLFINSDDALIYEGVVDSFDNQIDANSGTIRARAIFDNQDHILTPGMFAKIKMGLGQQQDYIVLSETAIGTDQDRKFVYVVDDNNIAQYREVKTGHSQKGKKIILSGLSEGDQVITSGLMRIQPNMPVAPQAADAGVQETP